MGHANGLDVVVRFHDNRRVNELQRCIFSLVGQTYRPLHINLMVQRFTSEAVDATKRALAQLLAIHDAPGLSVLNWEHAEPIDARSVLLNLGISSARGRYLAVLDYDDVLYPEAYELLVTQLKKSDAAIGFGGICVKRVGIHETFLYAREIIKPFVGASLRELFMSNFCPIHSFVVDRWHVPDQFLFFEPFITMQEDYDFLLRLCAQFPSDFTLLKADIGEYYYKDDGSNTVPTEGGVPKSLLASLDRMVAFIEQRRRTTPISVEVQRRLGIVEPIRGLTIRDFLDRG